MTLPKKLPLAAFALAPSLVSAQLISEDSFSPYVTNSPLTTQNPSTNGYVGAWSITNGQGVISPVVTAGSLAYDNPLYIASTGNKVSTPADAGGINVNTNSGRVGRLLADPLVVTNTTTGTLYLSWLFKSGNENAAPQPQIYQTLALFNGALGIDSNRTFEAGCASADFGNLNYGFRLGNSGALLGDLGVATDANVHLFVAKIELSDQDASDSVTIWLDPDLSNGEPTGGVTVSGANLAWDRIALSDYASNSSEWDEIRWGSSFSSVTTDAFLPAIPTFTVQPVAVFGYLGQNLSLSGDAPASPQPDYQWQKSANGIDGWTDVDGAITNTLAFSPAAYADRGFYRLTASNGNGSAISDVAEVGLAFPDPAITSQPASTVASTGGSASFAVTATGLGTLSYQWYKNNDPLNGETSSTLTLSNVQTTDAGEYSVEITDDAAIAEGQSARVVFSNIATLTLVEPWSGLVSHEPFDTAAGYTVGKLPGQTPSIVGYTGAWTDVDGGNAQPSVASGSLTYANANYLGSSGDKVSVPTNTTGSEITTDNSGRVYRMFDAPLVVNENTTGVRYLSFLFQSGQETGATTYQMLSLSSNVTGNGTRPFDIGITSDGGQSGTNYDFGVLGSYSSTGVAADSNVHLMVVKFDLSAAAGGDNVTVWVDPSLGSGDPTGGTAVSGVDLNWNRMFLSDYDGNSAAWDEIRWGSSFDSVTLNTNPSNTYATWIGAFSGLNGQTGFNDDPDADGMKNGVENVFGTDPGTASQGLTQVAKSGNTVTFQHPQNATPATDITTADLWSTDLVNFHASGETVGETTVSLAPATDTPTTGTTTVTATVNGTMPTKLFLVLRATTP